MFQVSLLGQFLFSLYTNCLVDFIQSYGFGYHLMMLFLKCINSGQSYPYLQTYVYEMYKLKW